MIKPMTLAFFFVFTMGVRAEMPDELTGTWIIDAVASETNFRNSPKFKPDDAKHLPTIFKRMAQVVYTFSDDGISAAMRGRETSLPVVLKSSEPGRHIFEGDAGEQTFTLTVTLNEEGFMNLRSSATDDMDYYLWRRGHVEAGSEASDARLAAEIIQAELPVGSAD